MGYEVMVCFDGIMVVVVLDWNSYDCIIVDLDMFGLIGIEVIEYCKVVVFDIEVVVFMGKLLVDMVILVFW